MSIFNIPTPVLVAVLIVIIVFIVKGLPLLMKQKVSTDYSNFDYQNSNAWHHFGGVGGPGFVNKQLKEAPTVHGNGKATMWLEGLPHAFTDLNINPMSSDCNFKIKLTADTAFGTRIDVYWNVDANGNKQQWDNMLIQNWEMYTSDLSRTAKVKAKAAELAEKEFTEELKGVSQLSGTNSLQDLM